MGFFSSLFGGSSPVLNSNINKFGSIGGFATSLGEQNLSQASAFNSALLSGDSAKIGKLLAPQTSAIQGAKQQQLNSTAQFHNRSGGTNSANQTAGDKARSSINDLVSSLTSGALGNASSLGSSLLNTGIGAYQAQDQADAQRMQNWSNSILGMGLTQGAGFAEGFGLGKI
jgi:hypothetical protein